MNRPRLETPTALVDGQRGAITEMMKALWGMKLPVLTMGLLGRIIAGTGGYHAKALEAGLLLDRGNASPSNGLLHRGAGQPVTARESSWATRDAGRKAAELGDSQATRLPMREAALARTSGQKG